MLCKNLHHQLTTYFSVLWKRYKAIWWINPRKIYVLVALAFQSFPQKENVTGWSAGAAGTLRIRALLLLDLRLLLCGQSAPCQNKLRQKQLPMSFQLFIFPASKLIRKSFSCFNFHFFLQNSPLFNSLPLLRLPCHAQLRGLLRPAPHRSLRDALPVERQEAPLLLQRAHRLTAQLLAGRGYARGSNMTSNL